MCESGSPAAYITMHVPQDSKSHATPQHPHSARPAPGLGQTLGLPTAQALPLPAMKSFHSQTWFPLIFTWTMTVRPTTPHHSIVMSTFNTTQGRDSTKT